MQQHYVGTKVIQAKPMTRGEYLDYREWELPEGEDASDEGYFIIYPDGYESWSPANVFEDAYLPLGDLNDKADYQQRVIAEKTQLDDRGKKLAAFQSTEEWNKLTHTERSTLSEQLKIMREYSQILGQRIDRF